MLNPFDATKKAIIEIKITKIFECFKFLFIFFPSTNIKLEIALTNVSIVLTVKDTAKIIITILNISDLSFNNIEKKAKSGLILLSIEIAIIPVTP